MTQHRHTVIIGAGILGLSIARELNQRHPTHTITLLEKEPQVGCHASGRNSGVLHSGIYYTPGSLKARLCQEGARAMAAYCHTHQLPIKQVGKVIVPTQEGDTSGLNKLLQQGETHHIDVSLINQETLKRIEPSAHSATGSALHLPHVAVVNAKAILEHLVNELSENGVSIQYNTPLLNVQPDKQTLTTPSNTLHYDTLINTAGMFADKVACPFGIGKDYTILPFKGLYYQLKPGALPVNGLIYPVPDMTFPFLGVHFTTTPEGTVYVGPTAIPALGRENYHGWHGMTWDDTSAIMRHLTAQFLSNHQGFRDYTLQEAPRFLKPFFTQAAQALVPSLESTDLIASQKVGIRAQLYNCTQHALEMDFVIEETSTSLHILNAVSPAFTSAFAFAKLVADRYDNMDGPARLADAALPEQSSMAACNTVSNDC